MEIRPRNRREPLGSQPDVDFPPVQNGIDYLLSVTDHLTHGDPPEPRDLKYAILHLQAAVEVLLKARLQREHWSQVFKNPGAATRARFESGDFESCTTDAALDRLAGIAGVTIADKAVKTLGVPTKSRNALQHYGLTTSAPAVEARAAEVLTFLMEFFTTELQPDLSMDEDKLVQRDLAVIRARLGTITSYLKQRHNEIRAELAPVADSVVECPVCAQFAVQVGFPDPQCSFCHMGWVHSYGLLFDYLRAFDRPGLLTGECPDCGHEEMLRQTRVAAAPASPRTLCFGCATSLGPQTATCTNCAALYEPGAEDLGMCPRCLAQRFEKL
ncbi:hypothetical protein ABT348_36275 [Streptomyces olivaceus]|uniref:hypothetical protein n=1 Tax=Streptomyces olivaceus TaxID=47716 RepID=UPI00331C1FDA